MIRGWLTAPPPVSTHQDWSADCRARHGIGPGGRSMPHPPRPNAGAAAGCAALPARVREGPAALGREGEVGDAANRLVGPPHPALSPGRRRDRAKFGFGGGGSTSFPVAISSRMAPSSRAFSCASTFSSPGPTARVVSAAEDRVRASRLNIRSSRIFNARGSAEADLLTSCFGRLAVTYLIVALWPTAQALLSRSVRTRFRLRLLFDC
jgi:hypothetical protein